MSYVWTWENIKTGRRGAASCKKVFIEPGQTIEITRTLSKFCGEKYRVYFSVYKESGDCWKSQEDWLDHRPLKGYLDAKNITVQLGQPTPELPTANGDIELGVFYNTFTNKIELWIDGINNDSVTLDYGGELVIEDNLGNVVTGWSLRDTVDPGTTKRIFYVSIPPLAPGTYLVRASISISAPTRRSKTVNKGQWLVI